MRGPNAFIAVILLVSASLLTLFGISALSPINPKKKVNDATNEALVTALEKPTVQFGNPQRGPANAAVTIVEFGDYQCEPCSQIEQALSVALAEYPTALRVVWKDLPNKTAHPDAMNAAVAARCASEQGAFWEYHDLLLANQPSINDNAYVPIAAQAGLDVDTFQSCFSSKNVVPLIERDVQEAIRLRVDSTPFLFINSQRIAGAITYDQLKAFIDSALAAPAPVQK